MTSEPTGKSARSSRDEASAWFARMRGPEAEGAREAFEAWLAEPAHARAYVEIETIWAAAGAARAANVPTRGREAIAVRHRSWTRPVLAAAALALAVVVLALLLSGYGRSAAPPPLIAYASSVGQVRSIALADGSRVTLDTASRIAVSFSRGERRVRLAEGRARFEVAHDSRPFMVLAGDRAVVARGTIFDVRLDDAGLEVVLLEGKVDIEPLARPMKAGTVRLSPGKRAVVRAGETAVYVETAAPPAASWTQEVIAADGMALGDLVKEANRYSAAPIELAQPELASLRVTGAFRAGDAKALGSALSTALDLSVAPGPDGSVRLSRGPT